MMLGTTNIKFNMVFLLTHISLPNALSLWCFPNTIWCEFLNSVGPDISVGIATWYVLDGPEWNPGGDEIFRTHPDRRSGPPTLLYNWYRVSFLGVKLPERGVDHLPLSCAEVKGRVVLQFYPLWAIMACSGVNFTLFFQLSPASSSSHPYHPRLFDNNSWIEFGFSSILLWWFKSHKAN